MKLIELVRRIFHEEVTAYTNVVQLSKRNYETIIQQDDQLTKDEKEQFKKASFFRHPKATNLILSVHPRLNDMQIQVVRDKIINLSNEIVEAKDFYEIAEVSTTSSSSGSTTTSTTKTNDSTNSANKTKQSPPSGGSGSTTPVN